MPYIKQEERSLLAQEAIAVDTAGQLNYTLTEVVIDFLQSRRVVNKRYNNYQDYNDVIGALEGCKLEFYRRKVAPYEDKKIEENGDVF